MRYIHVHVQVKENVKYMIVHVLRGHAMQLITLAHGKACLILHQPADAHTEACIHLTGSILTDVVLWMVCRNKKIILFIPIQYKSVTSRFGRDSITKHADLN